MMARAERVTVRTDLAATGTLRTIHPVMLFLALRMHLVDLATMLAVLLHLAAVLALIALSVGLLALSFLDDIRIAGRNHPDPATLGPALLHHLMSLATHSLSSFYCPVPWARLGSLGLRNSEDRNCIERRASNVIPERETLSNPKTFSTIRYWAPRKSRHVNSPANVTCSRSGRASKNRCGKSSRVRSICAGITVR